MKGEEGPYINAMGVDKGIRTKADTEGPTAERVAEFKRLKPQIESLFREFGIGDLEPLILGGSVALGKAIITSDIDTEARRRAKDKWAIDMLAAVSEKVMDRIREEKMSDFGISIWVRR